MIIDCGIVFPVVSVGQSQYHQHLEGPYQSSCPSFMRKKSLSSSEAFGGLAFLRLLRSFEVLTQSAFCSRWPTPVSYPCPSHPTAPSTRVPASPWGMRKRDSICYFPSTHFFPNPDIGPIPSRPWSTDFLCCRLGSAVSLPHPAWLLEGMSDCWIPFAILASKLHRLCFSSLTFSDASFVLVALALASTNCFLKSASLLPLILLIDNGVYECPQNLDAKGSQAYNPLLSYRLIS